jgi:hypothetical protein
MFHAFLTKTCENKNFNTKKIHCCHISITKKKQKNSSARTVLLVTLSKKACNLAMEEKSFFRAREKSYLTG